MYVLLMALFSSVMLHAYDSSVDYRLTGNIICSGTAQKAALAFDDNASTYYSTNADAFQWVGLDLGEPHVITRIAYQPAPGSQGASRTLLSIFEGANSPDFMDAVPLYLIGEEPQRGSLTITDINVSRGFRYIRYVGSAGSYCNIAELRFYGHAGEGDDSQFYQITNLPTLSVHVQDNILPTERGVDFESQSLLIYEGGTMIQDYPILFRVRGNYSSSHENKAFRIKYNDGKSHHMMRGSANEAPAKAKKWVLINSYRDKTLMRNPVAWAMSRRGEKEWTPWSQVVDLVVNGCYWGTYTLADAVSVDNKRIGITEMTEYDIDEENITGGYFVEVDNNASREPYWFTSSYGNPISVHEPDEDVIQPQQFNYIRNAWNDMESTVFSSDYTDKEKGLASVLDVESFCRHFLISEFNGNTDMLCQVFYYKERGDDHFYTGPIWDADLALENDQTTYPANERMDWTYKVRDTGDWTQFVGRVLSDPSVFSNLQEMWARLRQKGNFEPDDLAADVDSLREELRASANLNFIRWPYLSQWLSLNPEVPGSWEAEVDRVRNFVHDRVAWMDKMLSYGTLREENGSYQIASGRDLCVFSKIVNEGGETTAKGVIIADLDMQGFNDIYQPLGKSNALFAGSIDGKGHTIRNLHLTGDAAVGLVSNAGACKLSNISFDESCSATGNTNVGMLVGYARNGTVSISGVENHGSVTAATELAGGLVGSGRLLATFNLENCSNTGTVTAPSNAAALVGPSLGKLTVKNCFNVGAVSGATEGKEFAFANKSTVVENCWDYTSTQTNTMSPTQVENGELCYLLNGSGESETWRQNIDNGRPLNLWPVLQSSAGIVYLKDGRFTNVPFEASAYRYYKLTVLKTQNASDGSLQFSEFDLLDESFNEIDDLVIYEGPDGYSWNEGMQSLTDNSADTKFCGPFYSGMSFLFAAGEEVDAYGYRIRTANDTKSYPGRNLCSWRLYGSNIYLSANDEGWEPIDEHINDYSMPAANYTACDFYIPHTLKSLTLDKHAAMLVPGGELQLQASYSPQSIKDITFRWTSTDESVATVDQSGHVVAKDLGTTEIILSTPGVSMLRDTCVVSVVEEQVPLFRYYNLLITANKGDNLLQFAEFDILDKSLNEAAGLEIYDGSSPTYQGEGWANLTDNDIHTKYCANFNGEAYFLFDAKSEIPPYGYRFYTTGDTNLYPERSPRSWTLFGSNTKLTDPYDSRWEFVDQRYNDTIIQGVSYKSFDFYVLNVDNKLTLSKHSAMLAVGDGLQLEVSDRKGELHNMELRWTSTNEAVATVDEQGYVEATGVGTAVITVYSASDGALRDVCAVNVVAEIPAHRYYQLAIEAIASGGTIQLSEFDLLDKDGNEVRPLSLYSWTGSAVSNHPHTDLVDGSPYTKYCGGFQNGVTLYIYIDAGEEVTLSGYRFTTANDTYKYSGRNPITWTLFGSNTQSVEPDDACWEFLDRRENDHTLGAVNYTPYDFFFSYPVPDDTPIINFADAGVKQICVSQWDRNRDGELSEAEAAAVTSLGEVFAGNTAIASFNELRYFTGLTSIDGEAFAECAGLSAVMIPANVTRVEGFAFAGCRGLKEVYCLAETVPDADASSFNGLDLGRILLLVPEGTETAYRSHPVWKLFWVETPTSVNLQPAGVRGQDIIFDLSGRRQNDLRRGLNIKGGKTVLLK